MTGSDFPLRYPQNIPPRGISQGTLFCTFPDKDRPRLRAGRPQLRAQPLVSPCHSDAYRSKIDYIRLISSRWVSTITSHSSTIYGSVMLDLRQTKMAREWCQIDLKALNRVP